MSCIHASIMLSGLPLYRRSVLKDGVDLRLKELLEQIAKEIRVEIIEMEIMPDHVHLLIEVDPQFGIHRAVKRFKGAIILVSQARISTTQIKTNDTVD